MELTELTALIQKGESSKVQLKERLPYPDSIAQEFAAFANTEGGLLIIGVNDKTGALNGLSFAEIQSANQQLVNVASQSVFPSIYILTETVAIGDAPIVLATIPQGLSKPYKDRNGTIWMKNGADKRKVTDNAEIARLLQSSKIMYADEAPVPGTAIGDVLADDFSKFIQASRQQSLSDLGVSLRQALHAQNLMSGEEVTLAGLLLFGRNRHVLRPLFSVQCIAVNAQTLTGNDFTDNEPAFEGTLKAIFDQTTSFLNRNLRKVKAGESFNSPLAWEIPYPVFEELLVNALIHRDYFVNSTIKVFLFSDRVEIISPGKLPNSLTIDNIRNGISIPRNPVLQSLAQYILPYKGLGTGILRSLNLYPAIEFRNEDENNRFVVRIARPAVV